MTELIDRLRAVAATTQFGPETVREVMANALAEDGDWLDQACQQRDGDPVGKAYPLYRAADGRLSMLAVVFAPGATTPVHNHGAWAVVGTYRGRERDTWYRRLAGDAASSRGQLEEVTSQVSPAGTVTVIPDGTIHAVEALDGQEAVSLHVYGTDIVTQPRSTFDLATGIETPFSPPMSEPDHE
ncbi:cysteine dioxygenase family protein [Actinomycetospora lutea]|uniref:cysteine dioxygenase family protein n=1 Tax=Actinomycetospora lutea TaxID=663604 RepID=UPI002365F107|nr:cysteine dioxygenase family protein [Actinomycetospora lutea]MDD7942839.1 cysteine dioxygenase family protein [Actinomycetospora lutea]